MTRHEARMIAEELFALMQKVQPIADEYLTRQEAASMLKVSVSHLSHNADSYPSIVINGKRMYSKNELHRIMRKEN